MTIGSPSIQIPPLTVSERLFYGKFEEHGYTVQPYFSPRRENNNERLITTFKFKVHTLKLRE